MEEQQTTTSDAAPATAEASYPDGEYAIVELMGHQTVVGRISEVDRFGAKFMAIEPIYLGKLLTPILQGGASIYRCTPCSAEVAFNKGAREAYHLPAPVRATLPAHLLPAPSGDSGHVVDVDRDDDDDMPF